jgi:hypothetical protein
MLFPTHALAVTAAAGRLRASRRRAAREPSGEREGGCCLGSLACELPAACLLAGSGRSSLGSGKGAGCKRAGGLPAWEPLAGIARPFPPACFALEALKPLGLHGLLLRKQAPALGSPLASPPLLGANRRRPSLALPFLRQPRQPRHETE